MSKIFRTEKLSLNGGNILLTSDGNNNFAFKSADEQNVIISSAGISGDISSLAVKDSSLDTDISSLAAKDGGVDTEISSLAAKDSGLDTDVSSLALVQVHLCDCKC